MALEQFLPEGKEWDIPILDGITLATLLKYWVSVWETGFVSDTLNIDTSFTVMYKGVKSKQRMNSLSFGSACTESSISDEGPVIYVEGDLFCVSSYADHTHLRVQGLYSPKTRTGGFMITSQDRHLHSGYRLRYGGA